MQIPKQDKVRIEYQRHLLSSEKKYLIYNIEF